MGSCSSSTEKAEWVDLAGKCGGDGIRFNEEVINVNGKRRNVASWHSALSPPKAVVFVVHGLNEHSLCYYAVAHALVLGGYCVYAMDHVSHGKSDGERGLIRNGSDLHVDLVAFVNAKRAEHASVPAFMLAHSMGTLAAIMALPQVQDLRAAVFSGTALFAGPAASSPFGVRCLYPLSQTAFARGFTAVTAALAPRGMAAPLDVREVTSDPDELEEMRLDPRRGQPFVTNRTARELLQLTKRCKEEVPRLALPFLCIHGADDAIALSKGSAFLMEHAGTELAQRQLQLLPGLKHECFHELRPQGPESIQMVVRFFDQHCHDGDQTQA